MTRLRYGLNRGWRFLRGRAGGEPVTVDLPHCWNDTDTFQPGVDYYRGSAVYRLEFSSPEPGEAEGEWILRTEGFYGLATVRLNGHRLGRFDGQYLGIEIPVGEWLRPEGTNELEIRLTNKCPSYVLPGISKPDFLLFGGLAGHLWLEYRPEGSFDERTFQVSSRNVLVRPELELRYQLAGVPPSGSTVRWQVTGADGEVLDEWLRPAFGGAVGERRMLPDARLWSPEAPNLYSLRGELRSGERAVDTIETRFGLREASFTRRGFYLNGARCDLQGFNRHECVPGLGSALPEWLHREDVRTLRQLGSNFVRLSHYPQAPSFLDACDRHGLLVYAEIATWKSVRGGRWLRRARRQMEAMIRRDRNHPSIILWGMGNESQHRRAYVALGKIIHELDPGRPSTYAENHIYRARRARTLGVPDVWGLNYEVEALDEVREHCRTGSVVVAEACNQQAERGDTAAERMQIEAIEEFWRAIDGKPYVAGYTLWAYNDYPTMFRERYTRYTGKFDAWRLPKLAAYLFEARYAKTPFIRLVGAWGGVPEGTAVELDVFTNCQRVELSRGGPTIELEPGEFHRTIEVPYSAHPISATVHHSGGASSSRLRPFGNAAALTAYAIPVGVPEEGWFDLRLAVVDAGKEVVTGWRGEVRLGFSGPVRLVPLTAEGGVLVSRGRGRSFARRLAGGSVVVVAWADGLEAARIEIPDQGPVTSSTHRMPELLTTP